MLTIGEELSLLGELNQRLTLLKDGQVGVIEYGDPLRLPGGFLSYIRVRYMKVFGSGQFQVRILHATVEGGGAYFVGMEETAKYCMDLVRHYHRPQRIQVKTNKPELGWFAFREGEQIFRPRVFMSHLMNNDFPLSNCVEILLENPNDN